MLRHKIKPIFFQIKETEMNALLIYAHPNPASFCAAIKNEIVEIAKQKGENLEISDLYEMNFNPVLSGSDFESFQKGEMPADIKAEQDKISKADRIIVVYPVWWTGFPAILKGYFDRVLSYGFAYKAGDNGIEKLLTGKKAAFFTTSGTPFDVYSAMGMHDAMNKTSNTGVFEFCGIETKLHKYFGAVPYVGDDARKEMLAEVNKLYGEL